MFKIFWQIGSVILLIQIAGCGTNDHSSNQKTAVNNDPVYTLQIKTDSLFSSPQKVCLLALQKDSLNMKYSIDIGYNKVELVQTSQIAQNNEAIAAVNGGFCDVFRAFADQ